MNDASFIALEGPADRLMRPAFVKKYLRQVSKGADVHSTQLAPAVNASEGNIPPRPAVSYSYIIYVGILITSLMRSILAHC